MSIWNKVLVGLIVAASLPLLYLALRTLKTHQYWRELAQKHEKRIEELQRDSRLLIEGQGEGQPGIERLRLDLQKMLAGRGRAWRGCRPMPTPQTSGTGQVTVATDPHGIDQKSVLYVFDETGIEQGGQYLGEFKAIGVDLPNGQVTLLPSMAMTPQELQRLAASAAANATWTMYEVMPTDGHEAFAHLDEEQLRATFPAEQVEEYLKDGKPLTTEEAKGLGLQGDVLAVDEDGRVMYEDQDGNALYTSEVDANGRLVYVDQQGAFACAAGVQKEVAADGTVTYEVEYFDETGQAMPETRVIAKGAEDGTGRYMRRLGDYEVLLKSNRLQRSILLELQEAAAKDRQYVQDALARAEQDQKYHEREKALLTSEKEKSDYQHDAIEKLLQTLRREVQAYQDAVDQLITENRAVAAEIDRIQQDAKRRIDERTGRISQSTAASSR